MSGRIENRWILRAMPLLLVLAGCDPWFNRGCACSMDLRSNVCAQGKYDGMNAISYLRERAGGAIDSLASGSPSCFDELPGRQRILVYKNGARIDSSSWFTLRTVECCHGEDKTVVF
jgi:hypothetical protein